MAMGFFEVDTVLLKQAADEIRENQLLLQSTQRDLVDEMSKINKMWSGPAKEVYVGQFQEYCDLFAEILRQLNETLACMDNAVSEYEACDNRVNGLINALKV